MVAGAVVVVVRVVMMLAAAAVVVIGGIFINPAWTLFWLLIKWNLFINLGFANIYSWSAYKLWITFEEGYCLIADIPLKEFYKDFMFYNKAKWGFILSILCDLCVD